MKEENPASGRENLPIYKTKVVCQKCAEHIHAKQQDHFLNITYGNSTLRITPSNTVRIIVNGNYCTFEVLTPTNATNLKQFNVRSSLSNWEYLDRYGLVRVSRHTILNLAHIYKVEQAQLYSYYLTQGIEVTKTYHQLVSHMLNQWLDIQHRFPY